jgi:hypothetical protein
MSNSPRSPEIQTLVDEFKLERNSIFLTEEAFARWDARFQNWPRVRREADAAELIAVARMFKRQARGAAAKAVDQLARLAASLMVDPVSAARGDGFLTGANSAARAKMLGTGPRLGGVAPAGTPAPATAIKAFKLMPPVRARA